MLDLVAGKPNNESTICPSGAFPPSLESCRPKGYMERFVWGFLFSALAPNNKVACAEKGEIGSPRAGVANQRINGVDHTRYRDVSGFAAVGVFHFLALELAPDKDRAFLRCKFNIGQRDTIMNIFLVGS